MKHTTKPSSAHRFVWSVLGALLVITGSAPVWAQVAVSPAVIEVTVPQGGTATVQLVLSNAGGEPARVALSLAPAPTADDPPGEPGDLLFSSSNLLVLGGGGANALAALPDGRLFVTLGDEDLAELTPTLDVVRDFEHALGPLADGTVGLTYNADARSPLSASPGEGTLWWMEVGVADGDVNYARLREGTLGDPAAGPFDDAYDSQPTGLTLPVVYSDAPSCSYPAGRPSKLAYDAVSTPEITGGAGLFYWLDIAHDAVWAMDTLGVVQDGYPVPFTDYKRSPWGDPEGTPNEAECLLGFGLDAHALSSVSGLSGERVFEVMVGFQQELPFNRASRAVVTDRRGRSRGAETPLDDLPVPEGGTVIFELQDIVRSRVDPAVLYVIVSAGPVGPNGREAVYGVRAAPLPPRWLHAERVLWEVEADGEQAAGIRFETEGLAVGLYEGVVSVREGDGIGPVVAEVPVTLTVTESTDLEGEAEPSEEASLSVWPNPAQAEATVALTLGAAAEVRIVVYDVLGREVAVLADGPFEAGQHRVRLEASGLPAGVYLVRGTATGPEGGVRAFTERITLVR